MADAEELHSRTMTRVSVHAILSRPATILIAIKRGVIAQIHFYIHDCWHNLWVVVVSLDERDMQFAGLTFSF